MNIRSKPVILIVVAVLTIVIVGTIAVYILSSNKEDPTPTAPPQFPSPTQVISTSGPCKDFETLIYAKYPISCKKAVELALEQSQGIVQKVSIGSIKTSVPTSPGGIERRTVEMWLIDIVLSEPYFDDNFNKQISVLQVGIRTEEHNVLYNKPL